MTSIGERPVTESAPPPAPRRGRRWRRLGYALVVVIVLGVLAFVVAAETVSLVRHAKRAQASLEAFKTALKASDNVGAGRDLAAANAELARAHKSYHSFPLNVLGSVPVLGWPVKDAGHLLHAADDVSVAGSQALNLYDQVRGSGSKLFHNSTVNLAELRVVTGNADSMVARMDAATRELHRVRAAWWEPSVGAARNKALGQVANLREQGAQAQQFLDLAPGLVGAQGPRSYLVAVLNPAELEGAGGAALSMLTVRFDHGHMKILQSGSTFDLTNENTPTHFRSLPTDPWLHGSEHVLAAADRSPDFRTSGEELMRGYTAQFGQHLDGIIALDPVALADVMRQLSPITTPGYGTVTADNIVQTLLVNSYTQFNDPTVRHAYNDALMNTLLHAVLQGGHMLGKGKAFYAASKAGHVQVLMRDPAVQAKVVQAGLLRTLPGPAWTGDVIGVYTANGNASKVDYWQKRVITGRAVVGGDGSVAVTRSISIINGAPPATGPDIGSGYLTRVSTPKIALYLPGRATSVSLRVDGQKASAARLTEEGARVLVLPPVTLQSGQSVKLVLRYRLPAGTAAHGVYRAAVLAQPLVQPVTFALEVSGPGACRGAGNGWSASKAGLRYSTVDLNAFAASVTCNGVHAP